MPRKTKRNTSKGRLTSAQDTFDVLVLATMSAGKSAFINALVGHDLLPSGNEATTACLTSIEHRRTAKFFRGACYSHAGVQIDRQKDTSADQIRAWNANAHTKHIRLSGKFSTSGPVSAPKLVLHDTPGPNNSQDASHGEKTLEAVRTIPFKLLCYILDAGLLGTWDDRRLLEQLRDVLAHRSGHRLVFILNKVDLLDSERGEDIAGYVTKAKDYLEGLGFTQPDIIPTMANVALYARKALSSHALSRKERAKLKQLLGDLNAADECPLHAAALPDALKASVRKYMEKAKKARDASPDGMQAGEMAELEQLIIRSGIRTVEFLLHHRNIVN